MNDWLQLWRDMGWAEASTLMIAFVLFLAGALCGIAACVQEWREWRRENARLPDPQAQARREAFRDLPGVHRERR